MIKQYFHISLVGLLLLSMPLWVSVATATDILIFGLYAMAFNVALGFAGILSFGHAAFFGLGAYGAGMALRYFNADVWTALAWGTLCATVIALALAALCVKKRGVYFALLMAAFAQMFYFLALSPLKHVTGGEDGLKGIKILKLTFPFEVNLGDPYNLFIFVFIVLMVAVLAMFRILHSPFGSLLQGLKENEERLKACGYNAASIKILAFAVSGMFTGLAGALYSINLGYVPLDSLFWVNSGRPLVMTLLGGMHTFFGPLLGAGIFIFFEDTVSIYTPRWEIFVGGMVVVLVLTFPGGIVGTIKEKWDRSKQSRSDRG
ncbi:MAG: branched-chain amino acid ABC transporter permease [Deltaproteobacteria bacterium]|nr:branched-chain amino acid ABC transporter permease [Deltaproteobacteria bacterium]